MDTCYIFHVFNTLDHQHIVRALLSLRLQTGFEARDFVLYNSSDFDSADLLMQAQVLVGTRFRNYRVVIPRQRTTTTLADIQEQLHLITGAESYFLHKADFVLGPGVVSKAFAQAAGDAVFLNFCKFDLRETVEPLDLVGRTWAEVLTDPDAVDVTDWAGGDLSPYNKLGYRGWDGVMHAYSEAARRILTLDSFIQPQTVEANRERGVTWTYGNPDLLVYHQFHALPGGRHDPNKDMPGARF